MKATTIKHECDMLFRTWEAFVMNNMTKMFLGLGLSVLISLPVLAALKSGDKAPVFSAQAS